MLVRADEHCVVGVHGKFVLHIRDQRIKVRRLGRVAGSDEDIARLLKVDDCRGFRLCVRICRLRRRQVELDRQRRQRRGHHEDDEEHEHDVHEGRHVDVGILTQIELGSAARAGQLSRH